MTINKHSMILASIENTRWAMTPEALRGVLSVVDREAADDVQRYFHGTALGTKDAMAADIGQPVDGLKYSYIQGSTGVIFIDGPLIPRADSFSNISGVTSIENLANDFRALQNDLSVRRIVLAIDSPGGNIVGISEFAQMINASEKKTIAYVYGMAASAAYWIAAACNEIVTADTGEVGSIGVVMTYRDTSKQDAARGVETVEIVSSQAPYKRPNMKTEDGRASVQNVLDDLASVFIDSVAKYRGKTSDYVAASFGQGGLVVASRAVGVGMVDSISTLETILQSSDDTRIVRGLTAPHVTKQTEAATMSAETQTPLTASDLLLAHPEAVKVIQTEAANAERARIQGIESLLNAVVGAPAVVVSAASAVAAAAKYDPAKTADSIAREMLAVVGKAQADMVAAAGAGPRELSTKLDDVPTTPAPVGAEAQAEQEAATVSGLSAAMKTA